jgi:hypothetical protein
MLPAAYGLFLPGTILYFTSADFRARWSKEPQLRLFLVWLICVALLVFHDRWVFFARPLQPLHFTRGYLFIPLVYFSIRAVGVWLARARSRKSVGLLIAGAALAHVPDNFFHLGWLRAECLGSRSLYSIPGRCAQLMETLDDIRPTLTFHDFLGASGCPDLEYLIPVSTRHRSLLGHHFNTPDLESKRRMAAALRLESSPDDFAQLRITGLIVRRSLLDEAGGAAIPDGFRRLGSLDDLEILRID